MDRVADMDAKEKRNQSIKTLMLLQTETAHLFGWIPGRLRETNNEFSEQGALAEYLRINRMLRYYDRISGSGVIRWYHPSRGGFLLRFNFGDAI